jgi:hypothetical protein
MHLEWREEGILIWGKTYPELSSKYYETVCTGGVRENGEFIRLYPIPFRYLGDNSSFTKYQWIRVKIKKSKEDPRPESFKVDPATIVLEETIPSDKFEWFERKRHIFPMQKFNFGSAESLFAENRSCKRSMGFVRPAKVHDIIMEERPTEDYNTFKRKLEENRQRSKQTDLFEEPTITELKQLQFISKRFKVQWSCDCSECKGHNMSILDWEAYELQRKIGANEALVRLKQILMSGDYNVGFFLGNFRLHPTAFTIGSIWYPKRSNLAPNLSLF